MPKRSFETGFPCPWWYMPDGTPCAADAEGAERCHGWADDDNNPCSIEHPRARFEYGILEVADDKPYDGVTAEKRRIRHCIFCGAEPKSYEKLYGPGEPGRPFGDGKHLTSIYTAPVDNRRRLPGFEEYSPTGLSQQ